MIQWASANRKRIGLQGKEFEWARRHGVGLFDFSVSISAQGKSAAGRGSDTDETLALEKAVSEAVERCVCRPLGMPSAGVAAHRTPELARENAGREIVERLALHAALDGTVGFSEIDASVSRTAAILPNPEFFKIEVGSSEHVVIGLLDFDDQKFLGLGCSSEIEIGIDKAAVEMARNYFAFLDDKDRFLSDVRANSDLWCCDATFISEIEDRVFKNPYGRLALPELRFEKVDLESMPEFRECPLFIERAVVVGEAK